MASPMDSCSAPDQHTVHVNSVSRHLVFILDLVADVLGAVSVSDASALVVMELCGSVRVASRHQLLRQTEPLQGHQHSGSVLLPSSLPTG